jgi:hypothetical protein
VFRRSKFKQRKSRKVFNAVTRSPLIISQDDLKKFAVNPSRPGTFPEGVSEMAFRISSLVNGASRAARSNRYTFRAAQLKSLACGDGAPMTAVK